MTVFRQNIKGFHLEVTNKCTLKCPACLRTKWIDWFPSSWKNHDLELEDLTRFLDIDLSGLDFLLCGNYGDPIYHHDLLSICRWIKSKNANITIVTNGSYQKERFWIELASILTPEDAIVWSIDGTPDNFTQYRINADWKTIQQGIDILTKSPARTCWKYIVFNYNEDTISTAKELAHDLGIKDFQVSKSWRWDNNTDMIPSRNFVDDKYNFQEDFRLGKRNFNIEPECNNGKMHFISAEGYYTPCCYSAAHTFYYKSPWGNSANRDRFNIKKHRFSEIQKDDITINFEEDILKNLPEVCKFQCPKQKD